MNYNIKDFIGVFDNVLTKDFCQASIEQFERLKSLNKTLSRAEHDNVPYTIKDNEIAFTDKQSINDDNLYYFSRLDTEHFCRIAWECYDIYAKEYGILLSLPRHIFYDHVKMQKTLPSQGYHVWHCEHSSRLRSPRLLLVIAYLNDVEEGGETEFLYQSRRIQPKQGRIIICPSGFTHTHRGNPPLQGVKYIMNGWIEYCHDI